METAKSAKLDQIGTVASTICAIHCLATSLALGLLSVYSLDFLGSQWVEMTFFGFAIGIGSFAAIMGYRRHGSKLPLVLFFLGCLVLIISHFGLRHSHGAGDTGSVLPGLLSALGGLMLVGFHWVNRRLAHPHC